MIAKVFREYVLHKLSPEASPPSLYAHDRGVKAGPTFAAVIVVDKLLHHAETAWITCLKSILVAQDYGNDAIFRVISEHEGLTRRMYGSAILFASFERYVVDTIFPQCAVCE